MALKLRVEQHGSAFVPRFLYKNGAPMPINEPIKEPRQKGALIRTLQREIPGLIVEDTTTTRPAARRGTGGNGAMTGGGTGRATTTTATGTGRPRGRPRKMPIS